MTIAFDAATQSDEWTGTTPDTQTHTPAGTPKGVAIFALSSGSLNTDEITGASYGSLALTRVPGMFAVDAAGEAGTACVYFAGSGIPAGAQSCTVTQNAVSATRRFYVMTWTAADDTEVVDSDLMQDDMINAGATLDSGTRTASRAAALYSGRPSANVAAGAGMTVDFETAVAADARTFHLAHETTPSTGATALAWAIPGSDDTAAVFIAVSEVLPAGGGGASVVRSLPSLANLRSLISL